MNDGCSTFKVVTFIHDRRSDAQTSGGMLQVPASYLLGLSGWETTWGNNRFVRDGNNYFSLHGGQTKPFATGEMLSGTGRSGCPSSRPSSRPASRSSPSTAGR